MALVMRPARTRGDLVTRDDEPPIYFSQTLSHVVAPATSEQSDTCEHGCVQKGPDSQNEPLCLLSKPPHFGTGAQSSASSYSSPGFPAT